LQRQVSLTSFAHWPSAIVNNTRVAQTDQQLEVFVQSTVIQPWSTMAYYAPGTIIPSKLHLYQTQPPKCDFLPLLDLPGEIRNKIYDSVFEECLVDVRISSQRQVHDENNIDRRRVPSRIRPSKQRGKQTNPEILKPVGRQLGNNILPAHPNEDLKQQKPAPVLLQEQSRTQKCSKPQRGRRRGKDGPLRIYSQISPLAPFRNGLSTHYRVPLSFLLSSRQIYNEALCVMYSKAIFSFSQTKAINRFLSATPLRALQAIQGLHLSHVTTGEPELTRNRRFKLAADEKWLVTCEQTRQKMTGLKNLRLHLTLHDWPSQLGLREGWAQPILTLRGNGLDRVDATLFHSAFSEERLNEAARMLEIAMMSKEGQIAKSEQEKRMMEVKKKKKSESRAPRVLVIKMDNIPAAREPQKA
jgi:hypothetical protein